MDKAWKKRIDEWVQEKETPESPLIQPAVDNPQSYRYPSTRDGHPPIPTDSLGKSSDTHDPTTHHDRAPSISDTQTSNTVPSKSSELRFDLITSDQDEYFRAPSPETTLEDFYYTPVVDPPPPSPPLPPISIVEDSEIPPRLRSIQKRPSPVVSPRRPLPSTPNTPITSLTDQSSEGDDNAEGIQSLRLVPMKPSLTVSPPSPRALPPTPASTLIDQSREDKDDAFGFSIGTGNGDNGNDDTPELSTE